MAIFEFNGELKVTQKAKRLAEKVYSITRFLPKEEQYGLTSQMRRSAVSIPSNISEGSAKRGKDFIRFINIARGSLRELKTQIDLAHSIFYDHIKKQNPDIDKHFQEIKELADEVGRMTHPLSLPRPL